MKRILKRYLALLLTALIVITGTPVASFAVSVETPSIKNLTGVATGATTGKFTWDYNLPSGFNLYSSSAELNSVSETVHLSTKEHVLEGLVAEKNYALDIKAEFRSNEIEYTVDKIVTTSYDTKTYKNVKVYTKENLYYQDNGNPNEDGFSSLELLINHMHPNPGYTINPTSLPVLPYHNGWKEHLISDIKFVKAEATTTTTYELDGSSVNSYEDAKKSILSIPDYNYILTSEDSDFDSSNERKFRVVRSFPFELTASFTTSAVPAPNDYTITLVVEPGGIAFYNSYEYKPETYSLIVKTGDKIVVRSYSNAGYKGNGQYEYTVKGEGNEEIRISFTKENDVYKLPFYVTDGFFSGYHFDGSDISGHDPKDDILSASMTATPDKSEYALRDPATVILNVTVHDGDNSTKNLVEVDFYENGDRLQHFNKVKDSRVVSYTHTIPSTEEALAGAGYVKTNDGSNYVYTKTLNYDLVDRYNKDGAAAIIATAEAKLVVIIPFPAPITHIVTAISDNTAQGTVSPETSVLKVGETVEITATPKSNYYVFDHWTKTVGDVKEDYVGAATITVLSEDATYTAHFEQVLFDVTFDADMFIIDGMLNDTSGTIGKITFSSDNESFSPFSLNGSESTKTKILAVPDGTIITISAESTDTEYRFLKYQGTNENPRTVTIKSNKTSVEPNAIFGKKDKLVVTADYDESHVVFDKESSFLDDAEYTFIATPDANTTITKVTVQYGENPVEDITTAALTEARLMSYLIKGFESDVHFVIESLTQFDVNAISSNNAQGTVSPTTSTIVAGQPITVVATPTTGFVFSSWKIIVGETEVEVLNANASYTFDVNANISLVAYFTADQKDENTTTTPSFLVKFIDFDGSVIEEQNIESGSDATAPTDPKRERYTFIGWDKAFTNITSDLTVNAVYNLNVVNNNNDEEELTERRIPAPSPQLNEPVEIVDLGEEEEIAAGPALAPPVVEENEAPKEEVITLDIPNEKTPEGSGLPNTGQLPAELFVGLGGLITAAGAFLRRRK